MTTHLAANRATACCAAIVASLTYGKIAFARQEADAQDSVPPAMSATSHVDQAPPPTSPPTQATGVLGPLRIGPIVGTGLPNVLIFGVTAKLTPYFGAGVNFGLIPTLHIPYYGAATLAYRQFDIYGRIYPFGGAFFVGAGAGYATIRGTLTNRFDLSGYAGQLPQLNLPNSVDYTSAASVRTLVLTPQLGFLKVVDSGFFFEIDLGAQLPIAPSKVQFSEATRGLPQQLVNQYLAPNDQSVNDTLQKVGRTPIPTLGLHFGWLL